MPAAPSGLVRWGREGGFTLIEILLVVGVMAALLVGWGMAGRDNSGRALLSAQRLVASLVGQARAAAQAGQVETRLVVGSADSPGGEDESDLRVLQLFRGDAPASGTWNPLGPAVHLPRGVRIIAASTSAHPGPVSNLRRGTAGGRPADLSALDVDAGWFLAFQPDGGCPATDGAETRLVIAVADTGRPRHPAGIVGPVRGVGVRPDGSIRLVDHAGDF
jgi:type II secretory pathway pseudopilin PulG